jgi:glycine/D-amino acid oxidase-like deaminating enzyme
MNLSYWEYKSWLADVDFTIIGSGIVGLSCALNLKKRFPKSKILILEKGRLPQGASTKNAGFACFGSLSEIISDLKSHSEEQVFNLVKDRVDGLQLLRKTLGDKKIGYQNFGGYELFLKKDAHLFQTSIEQSPEINTLLHSIFKDNIFSWEENPYNFNKIEPRVSVNKYEGQIDTGKMMEALLYEVYKAGVKIINHCCVEAFSQTGNGVEVKTDAFNLITGHLLIATNGFTTHLLPQPVKPARAQVLITKPINDLKIKGTFHLDQGYYYFRNIDNRILFGGGRNLDFKTEETTSFGVTNKIQNELDLILKTIILPNTNVEVESRWSGIMGVGQQKRPIVKSISNRVHCGVRLGGMGVAIGSLVGKKLADLL